ncbi:hypothetical protein OB919_18060 [Halobacteria archaeon AArc-curdl1]|uniref:Halobacterial output domain-containing protein n=1 Tax=Natronosalvus hydrolyticus TaxID=2979988 RepID=A0AAP2ZB26_9EURY|nr:hypothetical protein [Halobacteria archaeon AArc-curdl1]
MTDSSTQSLHGTAADQYTTHFDRLDDEPLSVAIAEAVATVTDTNVTGLEPLHYAIDVDALERLFEPRADGLRDGGSVTFGYSECMVTVEADGTIAVEQTA